MQIRNWRGKKTESERGRNNRRPGADEEEQKKKKRREKASCLAVHIKQTSPQMVHWLPVKWMEKSVRMQYTSSCCTKLQLTFSLPLTGELSRKVERERERESSL